MTWVILVLVSVLTLFKWTTDQEIEDLANQYGKVKSVHIADDKTNGKSKG